MKYKSFFFSIVAIALLLTGCSKSSTTDTHEFEIKLNNKGNAKVRLIDKQNSNTVFAHYKIDSLPEYEITTGNKLQYHENIDNENTDSFLGAIYNRDTGEAVYLQYFKYTYYVKNIGSSSVSYSLEIKREKKTNPHMYACEEIMRVRLYENTNEEHKYETYAAQSAEGNKELVNYGSEEYCTNFIDDETVAKKNYSNLGPNEFVRYTILVWLEGTDPQCDGDAPKSGNPKISITIEAS